MDKEFKEALQRDVDAMLGAILVFVVGFAAAEYFYHYGVPSWLS